MKTLKLYLAVLILLLTINFNIYADGKRIPVCTGTGDLFLPSSEKSYIFGKEDGTMICWLDERNNGSLYIQKMNVGEHMEWQDNGVMLDSGLGSGFTADSDYPQLFSDNEGGAVVIYRKISYQREDVYMQRIHSNGELLENPVCLSAYYEGYNYSPSAVLTINNEVIVVWENFNGGNFDIHAQKLDMNGRKLWNKGNEIIISNAFSDQRKPTIACNENNIIFISWLDARNHSDYRFDLFACAINNYEGYTKLEGKEKLIFKNNMHSDSRKSIFYNHNIVSSEKNSFIVAVERSDADHQSSDIVILKVKEILGQIEVLDMHSGAHQTYPLIVRNADNGACIIWNEKTYTGNSFSCASLDEDLNIIWISKSGINIPCEATKTIDNKILPSEKIKNNIYTDQKILYFTWVNLFTRKLYLTGLHLAGESDQCDNTFEIQDEMSEGEFTSITNQRNSIVIIYKQSNNIFASVRKVSNDSFTPPEETTMISNFPNPFNPSTQIFFNIPSEGFVRLNVFDISGKLISTLVNEFKTAGKYDVIFRGSGLSSGVYFYRLSVNGVTSTKRMMMIK
ncbi:MAG: T9SS type A sorting domain-containing protein [bacterium]